MTYNTTFMDNATTFMGVVDGVNSSTNGYLGAMILLGLAVVLFIVMKNFDSKSVFIATSFITSIVGMFLFTLGWIGIEIFILPIVALVGSLFYAIAIR